MTIYRRLVDALYHRSKYEQHWVRPAGKPAPGTMTRQRTRHAYMTVYYRTVAKEHPEMPRRKRRQLARANAARMSSEKLRAMAAAV